MKKILAILLALMLVLVNVAALADATLYEPGTGKDEGTDTVGNPRVMAALANGGSISLAKVYEVTGQDGAKIPKTDITFTAELEDITDSTVDTMEAVPTFSYTPSAETAVTFAAAGGESADEGEGEGEGEDEGEDEGEGEGEGEAAASSLTATYTDANLITITFPTYPEVGVYHYTVKETGTAYAGVTYSKDLIMKVTVIRQDGELKIAGVALRETETGEKLGEITNEYKAGTLIVKKTVSGNMGSQDEDFTIEVTFSAPSGKTVNSTIGIAVSDSTVTSITGQEAITAVETGEAGWTGSKTVKVTVKHNSTITFTNVPYDVTYKVEETEKNGYTATGEVTAATAMGTSETTVTVNNEKNIIIDTGIALDSGVYMLIMALTLVGVAVLALRRREEY